MKSIQDSVAQMGKLQVTCRRHITMAMNLKGLNRIQKVTCKISMELQGMSSNICISKNCKQINTITFKREVLI